MIMLFIFKDIAIAAKDAMAGQLEMIKVKYEEALEMRKKAELDIEAFRPVWFQTNFLIITLIWLSQNVFFK